MERDRIETQVYHIPQNDLFFTIDRAAEAERGDWVAVERPEGLHVERFARQPHAGVIRMLEFWRLEHSEQCAPRPSRRPLRR